MIETGETTIGAGKIGEMKIQPDLKETELAKEAEALKAAKPQAPVIPLNPNAPVIPLNPNAARMPVEGDRVFYKAADAPYAEATITKVWGPAMVNLRIDGADHDVTSVNKRAGETAEDRSWWFQSGE